MIAWIVVATVCAAVCFVMALAPQPVLHLSKLPAVKAPRNTPMEPQAPRALMVEARRGFLHTLLSWLGRLIPQSDRHAEGLRVQLVYAGLKATGEEFGGIEALLATSCALGSIPILMRAGLVNPVWILLAGLVGFLIPSLWLKARIRRRHRAIVKLLPEVIDIWSLCVGAGLDFLGSLNRVVALKAFKDEPLIEELAMALQEVRLGKRRFEAFKAMAKRVNLPELSSFVRTLVQADRMGTPVAEVLEVHSEDMRLYRFTRAERAALRAPIKILVPLIFFIMPCVGIIVAAPIFLQFMRQNPFGQ